jgi:hypothetical protein
MVNPTLYFGGQLDESGQLSDRDEDYRKRTNYQLKSTSKLFLIHTTTGCGKQGFPSAQPYLSHTPAG